VIGTHQSARDESTGPKGGEGMSAWMNGLLLLLRSIPTVAVLLALAGLAGWGAHKEWKLGPMLFIKPKEEKKTEKEEYAGVGPMTLPGPESAEKAGIEVEEAKNRPVTRQVTATASLAFDHALFAQLASRAPGTAWRILKKLGDPVRKGDVLMLVSAAEVGQSKANLLAALVHVDIKTKFLQQLESAGASIPVRQRTDAQTAVREGQLRVLAERHTLANLGLYVDTDKLRGLDDVQLARAIRRVGLEKAFPDGNEPADLPSNLLPLLAPFDGVVVRRDIALGETVGPSTPIFTIADILHMHIELDIRPQDAALLRPGQKVTFWADSTDQTAVGQLEWVSPEVDPKTRTFRAHAEVDNPDGSLRAGVFGKASIVIERIPSALTVPSSAVSFDGRSHLVFLRCADSDSPGQRFCPRLVLPGVRRDGYTELLESSALLPASLVGLAGGPLGPLTVVPTWNTLEPLLTTPRAGESVVTTGGQVLRSELLRSRIRGEE
jgi:membrane fusion protein, heavy metal efflux system